MTDPIMAEQKLPEPQGFLSSLGMPGVGTTPLEREILTHYWTSPGPYKNGSEHWTQTHNEIIGRFLTAGLLIQYQGDDGLSHIRGNDEALRAYMEALSAVPLPVQKWVVK